MHIINKRIFFRVDGDHGVDSGLGHLNRVLKIYNYLKKKNNKYKFFFIIKKKHIAIKILKELKVKIYIYNKIFLTKKIFKPGDLVIIDTLGSEKLFVRFIKKHQFIKVISFDELRVGFHKIGTVINGILFTKKILKKKKNIYQGLKYLLLDNKFKKKIKPTKNNNILITSGGSDKKNFIYKILKILIPLKLFNIKYHVVIGKGFLNDNKIFKFLNKKDIVFHKDLKNLKTIMDKCNYLITSGGTVMFEAISTGRIVFSSQTYINQKYNINYFKKKNLIYYIGRVESIKKKYLEDKIKFYMQDNNKKKIENRFYKKRSLIDGKGFDRIIKIIEKEL